MRPIARSIARPIARLVARRAILLFSVLLSCSAAYAWGPTGHRTTAEIAQRHLDTAPASACSILLGGYTLADVANWPDEIRDDPKYDALEPLHFVDVPVGTKRYQDAPLKPEGDAVQAVRVLTQYLKTGNAAVLKAIPAFTKVPIDKNVAIKLLVHFVGDIHQPMHVGFDGEKGGNNIHVKWMGDGHANLHSVWDSKMIDAERLNYMELAAFLDHATPEQRKALESLDPADWTNESLALHDELRQYPDDSSDLKPGEDHVVSYKYIAANRETLHNRLLAGGIRLANLLNSIFPNSVEMPR